MSAGSAEVRSFVAVPLPLALQQVLFDATQELASAFSGADREIRWTRKVENFHVTMKFLDKVPEHRLLALSQALRDALADQPPFAVAVRDIGAFPGPGRASVIWAGIDDPGRRLAQLAAIVEDTAAGFGFTRESRRFRGHVTLGRCRRALDVRDPLAPWRQRSFGTLAVTELHVYESQLGKGTDNRGSTYVLRARAPFGAAGAGSMRTG